MKPLSIYKGSVRLATPTKKILIATKPHRSITHMVLPCSYVPSTARDICKILMKNVLE